MIVIIYNSSAYIMSISKHAKSFNIEWCRNKTTYQVFILTFINKN